jgi:hypothetical protein
MKNVTLSLDDDVARWARVRAAERDQSVSRFVAELLRERMRGEDAYQGALQQYVTGPVRALKRRGARYPRRDELHARDRLR